MKYRIIKTWDGLYEIQKKAFFGWQRFRHIFTTLEEAKQYLDSMQKMYDQRNHPNIVHEQEIPNAEARDRY